MSLFKIAWRSIQQRAMASSLTALSMALGVALVIAVLVIHGVVNRSFEQGAEGYELLVGAKGDKLQLVLNTVYHLSAPVENVPWSYYQEFLPGKEGKPDGRFASQVKFAIPYCLGDNYQGYRIVGTTPQLFEVEYAQGKTYSFLQGHNFQQEKFFEAVVGYLVAQRTGLKVGDEFQPTHGIVEKEDDKHDAFKVVGVLNPTGTPNDRAVFINMEGFFLLEGHAKPVPGATTVRKVDKTKPLPEEQREVTAILVRGAHMLASMSLTKTINKEPYAQAVAPAPVIQKLFSGIVGNVQMVLLILAVLIVVVAGIGIMVSIYNSMSARQREIAIMRSLGASRGRILSIVLLESILLSLLGGVLGMVLGHGLIGILNPLIVSQTGVTVGMFELDYLAKWEFDLGRIVAGWPLVSVPIYWEFILIPGLVALASLVGFLPALSAYRTNVSKALTANG